MARLDLKEARPGELNFINQERRQTQPGEAGGGQELSQERASGARQ